MLEFLEKKKNDRFQLTASRTTFPFRRYVYCMCIYIYIYTATFFESGAVRSAAATVTA